MSNITYTPETDETLASIAEKLTGYHEYASFIAQYNNLPESMTTVPAGQTITIPQEWSKTTEPMEITVTGGAQAAPPDYRKILIWGFIGLAALVVAMSNNAVDNDPESA